MGQFRKLAWKVAAKILFQLDAEGVHDWVVFGLEKPSQGFRGLRFSRQLMKPYLKWISGEAQVDFSEFSSRVLGMEFRSRVGLAAGFDKNAQLLSVLPDLGFGFAEIGTVTPLPQPGHARPRLFRDSSQSALFNRMGFNNQGSLKIAENVRRAKENLPSTFRVGVNIGKNKDTPLDQAARDYRQAAIPFEDLADYFVLNVSSPNTKGLRDLQTVEHLVPMVSEVKNVVAGWKRSPPLFLKIAPEVSIFDFEKLVRNLESVGVEGWVLTNTLAGTWPQGEQTLDGGWSGGPLAELSKKRLIEARKLTNRPIISVGGILTPGEARDRILKGASLIQVYTGWIYGGPTFPVEITKGLV